MPFRLPAAFALLALAACATPVAPTPSPAQEITDPALTALIAEKDAAMFAAFNSCDGETFGAYLEDGLEFYHDQAGLSAGRAATVDAVNENVCNKFTRQLVPGSLEVWPIPGYGAVETGLHTFTNVGAEAPHGIARFLHVWHEDAGVWRVARIVSYAHAPYPPEPASAE